MDTDKQTVTDRQTDNQSIYIDISFQDSKQGETAFIIEFLIVLTTTLTEQKISIPLDKQYLFMIQWNP